MSANQRDRVQRLHRQLGQLVVAVNSAACTCRGPGRALVTTDVHTIQELEVILYLPCPVHKFRHPGILREVASDVPLQKPDWPYCTCPPEIWRDYMMGRRPMPTPEESKLHENDWVKPWEAEFDKYIGHPDPAAKDDLKKHSVRKSTKS